MLLIYLHLKVVSCVDEASPEDACCSSDDVGNSQGGDVVDDGAEGSCAGWKCKSPCITTGLVNAESGHVFASSCVEFSSSFELPGSSEKSLTGD